MSIIAACCCRYAHELASLKARLAEREGALLSGGLGVLHSQLQLGCGAGGVPRWQGPLQPPACSVASWEQAAVAAATAAATEAAAAASSAWGVHREDARTSLPPHSASSPTAAGLGSSECLLASAACGAPRLPLLRPAVDAACTDGAPTVALGPEALDRSGSSEDCRGAARRMTLAPLLAGSTVSQMLQPLQPSKGAPDGPTPMHAVSGEVCRVSNSPLTPMALPPRTSSGSGERRSHSNQVAAAEVMGGTLQAVSGQLPQLTERQQPPSLLLSPQQQQQRQDCQEQEQRVRGNDGPGGAALGNTGRAITGSAAGSRPPSQQMDVLPSGQQPRRQTGEEGIVALPTLTSGLGVLPQPPSREQAPQQSAPEQHVSSLLPQMQQGDRPRAGLLRWFK